MAQGLPFQLEDEPPCGPGSDAMDERLTLNDTYSAMPGRRSGWAVKVFGKDWGIGYLFVLPMAMRM